MSPFHSVASAPLSPLALDRKILNLIFLGFAWVFTSTRKLSSSLWLFLVLYLDLYILIQYFCQVRNACHLI